MERKDIIGICAGAAVTAIGVALVVTRNRTAVVPEPPRQPASAKATEPVKSPVPAPPPAPAPPSTAERLMSAKSLVEVIGISKPEMTDTFGESSAGTAMLLAWSARHMKWTDVAVDKDETSYALIRKDVDSERGKRVCISGPIIQIEVERVEPRFCKGLMESARGDIFHFYAVRSTSDLVQSDIARFCGVVTGFFDYNNSSGGVGHGVDIVGMFDLSENKK